MAQKYEDRDYDDQDYDDQDYDDRDDRRGRSPSRQHRVREFAGKKVAAGVLGILLGAFGIHKFVLGFPGAGIIMLLTTLFTFATGLFCFFPLLGTLAISIIGLVEGILYLTKSDEDFYQSYKVDKRSWF